MPEDLRLKALVAKHTPAPRRHTESNLLPRLIEAAKKLGTKLYRNQQGSYKLADGRYITSGLCVGSSDLIGYSVRVITPDMVGQKVCIFTAIEAKAASGRATERQMEFVKQIREAGGIAQIVRSVLELEATLTARAGD